MKALLAEPDLKSLKFTRPAFSEGTLCLPIQRFYCLPAMEIMKQYFIQTLPVS